MASNPLSTLRSSAFSDANLLNLQQISVPDCRIASVAADAFASLINLVELDLSGNLLQQVPSHSFEQVSQLRELRLSHNPLKEVRDGAFRDLPALVRLELSGCGIMTLGAGAFDGLLHLQWLRLDSNRLTHLTPAPLRRLSSLHGVDLHANPFNCTCRLRALRQWMLGANVPSVTSSMPTCATPVRLAGRAWDSTLSVDQFACMPKIHISAMESANLEGGDNSLYCKASGMPRPVIRWTWNGQVLRNGTRSESLMFIVTIHESSSVDHIVTSKLHVIRRPQNKTQNEDEEETEEISENHYYCHASNAAGEIRRRAVADPTSVIISRRDREDIKSASSKQGDENENSINGRMSYVMAAFGGCAVIFLTLFFACCAYNVRQKSGNNNNSNMTNRHYLTSDRGEYQMSSSEEGLVSGDSANKQVVLQVPDGRIKAYTAPKGVRDDAAEKCSNNYEKISPVEPKFKRLLRSDAVEKAESTSSNSDQGYKSLSCSSSFNNKQANAQPDSDEATKKVAPTSVDKPPPPPPYPSNSRVRFNLKPMHFSPIDEQSDRLLLHPLRLRSPSDPLVSFLPPEEDDAQGGFARAKEALVASQNSRINRRVRFRTR